MKACTGGLFSLPVREGCFGRQEVADVCTLSLNEMGGQIAPVGLILYTGQVFRKSVEFRVKEGQQGTERRLLAAVRRRRNKDHVLMLNPRKIGYETVTLVPGPFPFPSPCTGMRFINDD